ncbi:MAG: hypothetical protein V1708_00240 [Candidatus Micrarchaeota archaeon]
MAVDADILRKIEQNATKIQERMRDADRLVKSKVATYPVLLLGDSVKYPLLRKGKEHLKSKGYSAFLLEDIQTDCLTDAAKMDCLSSFKEGSILLLDGSGPGTATEVTIIRSDDGLRFRTELLFEGKELPLRAKTKIDYPVYFPRKRCFEGEQGYLTAILEVAEHDAYAQANNIVAKLLGSGYKA